MKTKKVYGNDGSITSSGEDVAHTGLSGSIFFTTRWELLRQAVNL